MDNGTLEVGLLMHTQRTHVILPQDLLAEIDALVGPRGRSAFLVETARSELKRRHLLAFLNQSEPAWRDEDHPELASGSAAWVRKLRAEEEAHRSSRLKKHMGLKKAHGQTDRKSR
jgi:metal-responsive CopG/Arc/MetJ family transcriptional regulator